MKNPCLSVSIFLLGLLFLLPPHTLQAQNMINIIERHTEISDFANALKSTGLEEKLSEEGPFTIFAPANEPLQQELSGQSLTSPSARKILLNHIITGYATERNMKVMSKTTSLGGITLVMKQKGNRVYVNDIEVITYNIKAKNGVIHILNGVLK